MPRFSFVLLFAFFSQYLTAQVLPGQNDYPELGLKFQVPDGWTAQLDGEVVVMGHESIAGLMILSFNEAGNTRTLKEDALEGVADEGVNLRPVGEFKVYDGNKVSGYYEGTWDGAQVRCLAIGMVNGHSSGVNVLVLTTQEIFGPQQEAELRKLSGSIEFYKPKVTAQTVRWRSKLVPAKIEYLSSDYSTDYSGESSGTSSRERIILCSNGHFDYYTNSQATFSAGDGLGGEAGSGHARNNGKGQGTFELKTIGSETNLMLTFESGEVYEYALSTNAEGNTFLNGTRYFVVGTEYCD